MRKIVIALEVALVLFPAVGCASSKAQAPVAAERPLVADLAPARVAVDVPDLDASPLYFQFDEDALDDGARARLLSMAKHMRANPELEIAIEGHCDDRGTSEYNLALGERRGEAARRYLVALGVDEARIRVVSFGEELPAVEGTDDLAWAQNRRDEFVLYKSNGATARKGLIRASVEWGR